MVKTSSKKSRGIRGSVVKHLIRMGQNEIEMYVTQHRSILTKGLEKVGPLASAQWAFILHTCTKWNLMPVEFDTMTGKAGLSALWKRCVYYVLMFLYAIIMIYRVTFTIGRVADGNLDISTYICAGCVLISFASSLAVVGTTCLSSALCDLFKSWKSMESISELSFERSKKLFDDASNSTKVLLMAIVLHMISTNATMFSLTGLVPVSVLPTLTRMGWLKLPDFFPRIIWSLMFLPLELLTYWPALLPLGVCLITLALGLAIFKLFADQLRYVDILKCVYLYTSTWTTNIWAVNRKEKINNMNDWKRVYQLRGVMQVYNIIFMDWAGTVGLMGLIIMSCAVILMLYVTLRPSNIPWLIYIWFPISAALIMVVVTWICYEGVIVKRIVADVEGNLHSGLNSWRFRDMKKRRRTIYNRMLKALRPAYLSLGPFGEISFDVPINAWDEVLNQLLFLLSL